MNALRGLIWGLLLSLAFEGAGFMAIAAEDPSSCGARREIRISMRDGLRLRAVFSGRSEAELDVASAAVLLLPGSGNVSVDGDVSGPFLGRGYGGARAALSEQLAEALCTRGVASLRLDKRGFEDSRELSRQTLPYLAADAVDAFHALESTLPGASVSIAGFSEGALLAVIAAAEVHPTALYLFSPPTRPIDEVLGYQFLGWPTELLSTHVDRDRDGRFDARELEQARAARAPYLGPGFSGVELSALDQNHDGEVSVASELIPTYTQVLRGAMQLTRSPAFSEWYQALRAWEGFGPAAARIGGVPVRAFVALEDAQVRAADVLVDLALALPSAEVRTYAGLGHCFSPYEGPLREVKTSGPFASSVVQDFMAAFSQ